MKKIMTTVGVLMFILALAAPLAFANAISAQPGAQDPAADEAAAYKAWYDAYTAKDLAKEMELGKAFVEKFPNSKNADYVKKDIIRVRSVMLNQAVQSKNIPDIIRIGKEAMAADPESVDYPYFLATQLRTLDTNFQYATDMAQFTQTAMRLIEAGKKPTIVKDFNDKQVLAYFHDTLASIDEHNKDADKALEHYEHAAMLDPMNARYFFNCGRLHQGRYADAAKVYQALPEADRTAPEPKPEVKAALDKVNAEADGVINCWARFMGLPKNDYPADVKTKVMTALTDLYKYRNNGSDAGLQKLIDDNKASATPVKMTPPVEQKPTAADQKPADQSAAKPTNGSAVKKPKM